MPWYSYLIGAVSLAVVGNYIYWIFFTERPPKDEAGTIAEGEDDGPYDYWP